MIQGKKKSCTALGYEQLNYEYFSGCCISNHSFCFVNCKSLKVLLFVNRERLSSTNEMEDHAVHELLKHQLMVLHKQV